jgi:hypothetical protein
MAFLRASFGKNVTLFFSKPEHSASVPGIFQDVNVDVFDELLFISQ